jgi:hypothetical protein
MTKQNIIHRSIDYFGIAYYGFLALYSLFELFFAGGNISMLVLGPIIYAFSIYGTLHLVLIPFYALGKFFSKEKGIWEQIKTNFAVAIWSLFLVIWIADMYLDPTELDSLFETSSLAIMLIAIIDILVRLLLFQPAENGRKINLLDRLKRVDEVYPIGSITVAGFFVGFYVMAFLYLPTDRHDPTGVIFSGGIILLLYLLLIEWINRKVGKGHQGNDHPMVNHVVDGKKGHLLFHKKINRRWSFWITLLGAIVLTFITYNLLSFTMSQIPHRRFFILIFVETYALLAWIRWMETRGYKYGSWEGQS